MSRVYREHSQKNESNVYAGYQGTQSRMLDDLLMQQTLVLHLFPVGCDVVSLSFFFPPLRQLHLIVDFLEAAPDDGDRQPRREGRCGNCGCTCAGERVDP